MYRALIVDDEKIEREGVRLIMEQQEDFEMFEASDGSEALEFLKENHVDVMMTDMSMPKVDGLELIRRVRELYPDLLVVILSGYSDFAFAQEANRYQVTDCVLKPIDADDFVTALNKVRSELAARQEKEAERESVELVMHRHYLQSYLYSGQTEVLQKAAKELDLARWNAWHRAVMIESAQPFFDTARESLWEEVEEELHRSFFYLNLNTRQSILFFDETYVDYVLIAKRLYVYLKQKYTARFYLSVSGSFKAGRTLIQIFTQLEREMEEKFYHPDTHVFTSEEDKEKWVTEETQDSQMMQLISEDISRKDVQMLKQHFGFLVDKYQKQTQFSAMYVKFVFSNVIQELFQEESFVRDRRLDLEIDKLYACSDIGSILEITRQCITEYEIFLERMMKASRNKVEVVKKYIQEHFGEDISLESMAEKVHVTPAYLNLLFRKEVGRNMNRYVHDVRMKRAKELLMMPNSRTFKICAEVGFINFAYFQRSFHEYYGYTIEDCRRQS
ncbi:MAG: response regulator [Blautia sp.]|nr:response regulator [Blautia sp.]